MYKLGIDLGGTKIEGIILDEKLNSLKRYRIPTFQEKGYENILERIQSVYKTLLEEIDNKPHTLGIGTPGVKSTDGKMKNSSLICLNGQLLYDDLKDRLKCKLGIQNDANCFAMAEAIMGSGKGRKMVFGVIMGTGCGGGIVFDRKLFCGAQNIAGEWGHTTIDPHGEKCFCGKRGCVETVISGTGVERMYEKLSHEKASFLEIVQKYREGEGNAGIIMKQFFENFGRSISNLINTLDPDMIVLGGGLSNLDELYTLGIEEVKRNIFNGDHPETHIAKNLNGDSAGVYGAALIGI
jgi:fructokinase